MKIKNYENYEIFEDGSIVNSRGLVMKCFIQSSGYKQTTLYKNNIRKKFLLHRLLALHFIENTRPLIAITVDHIDRDRLNNSLENLRWATREEQTANRGGQCEYPISKGSLYKYRNSYYYEWREDRIKKVKSFKNVELAQAFQIEHLKTYRLQSIN
tara:strand:+ start:88 stop:555 length:468 start_codon:yes stop_codon:yes gene_type:complete